MSPLRPEVYRFRFSTKISAIRSFSLSTVLAECGLMRTLGMSQSGESVCNGSTRATSRAANAMCPILERLDQSIFVNHCSTRDVDEYNTLLHPPDHVGIDHVLGDGRVGHAERDTIGLLDCVGQLVASQDLIGVQFSCTFRSRLVDDRQDAHTKTSGETGNFGSDLSRSDDRHHATAQIGSAVTLPTMKLLLTLEMQQTLGVHEQRHHDEFGERHRMDAPRGSDGDRMIRQPELADELTDAGTRRLNPFDVGGMVETAALSLFACREIPQDRRAAEIVSPALLLLLRANESVDPFMIRDVTGRRVQVGLVDDRDMLRSLRPNACHMPVFQRRRDEDDLLAGRHTQILPHGGNVARGRRKRLASSAI